MFHVEQFLEEWFISRSISLPFEKIRKLGNYINAIHSANNKFNITGFSNLGDITTNLVLSSLEPVLRLNVPRGTTFVDMGSGSGIPGIPLCIYNEHFFGTMVESNHKKFSFIASMIDELLLHNALALNNRGEDMGRSTIHRERYFFCFSRAFSSVYTVSEVCSPLLSIGGWLYIYSRDTVPSAPDQDKLEKHIADLGLSVVDMADREGLGVSMEGILLRKVSSTPERYPRRHAVIKRDSLKIHGPVADH